MDLIYFYSLSDDNASYSVDMVRYRFKISKFYNKFLQHLYNFLRKICVDVQYYQSLFNSGYGKYKYLFQCTLFNGAKFKLGFDLLNENGCSWSNFIEYNPNKCCMTPRGYDDSIFLLFEFIFQYSNLPSTDLLFELVRFDLAIDINVERERVLLVKNGKSTYHKIIAGSVTEYLGTHNNHGFVKVYDKTEEINKNLLKKLKEAELDELYDDEKLDKDITRVEITLENIDNLNLPEIYILDSMETDMSELNDTQKVIVDLINKLPVDERAEYLNRLGRYQKIKLKPFVFGSEKRLKFNHEHIYSLYQMISEVGWRPASDEELESLRPLASLTGTFDDIPPVPDDFEQQYDENPEKWKQYRIDDYLGDM